MGKWGCSCICTVPPSHNTRLPVWRVDYSLLRYESLIISLIKKDKNIKGGTSSNSVLTVRIEYDTHYSSTLTLIRVK